MLIFLIMTLIPLFVSAQGDCNSPPSKGIKSPRKMPEIRYYFDQDHMSCYPFKYLGSGGNENNYKNEDDCYGCMPADFSSCGYNIQDTGSCSMSEPGFLTDCPKGSECHGGAFFGFCCPKDKTDRAENPKCPPGKQIIKNKEGYKLISKSCTLDFCPSASKCIDGEFYAYCCQ